MNRRSVALYRCCFPLAGHRPGLRADSIPTFSSATSPDTPRSSPPQARRPAATFPRADLAVAFRYLNGGSLNAVEQQA